MRKHFYLLLIGFTSFISAHAVEPTSLGIIPEPAKMKQTVGTFTILSTTTIQLLPDNAETRMAVERFNELLQTAGGFKLQITNNASQSNTIVCKLNPAISSNEGYSLSVKKTGIDLQAKSANGIFYALQTVRQLLPKEIESPKKIENIAWTVPCVEIEDAPRYSYRGLMLDCSRHFMPKEFVLQYIDLLSYHKLNKFHWHLTEDQGWRIEIKKYPKLTELGAYRNRTLKGAYQNDPAKRQWDMTRHGGFYTQEDIKEVVAYAKKRFVTVVPEIEMPGHALAALASFPELSCTGGPFEVEGLWGVFNDIYCTREEVFKFLEDVLTEVCALFPSEYIHIGGDEAPKLRWQNCAHCQARMKKEGLKDEHELQSYFITRMEKFINSKGKKIIGWDEILEGGLAPNATVMSWRGISGGIAAAKQNHDVVMTPGSHVYLDHYQSKSKMEPHAIGGYSPIWHVYSFEPTPAELTPDQAKHILGVQGNLWTEYVHTPEHAIYMTYPRGAAIAEVAWSPKEKRNYDRFSLRLNEILKRYNMMEINYNRTFLSEDRDLINKK